MFIIDEENLKVNSPLEVRSEETDHDINEAVLYDMGLLTEDVVMEAVDENILSEKSIVRLDKYAKLEQAKSKAVLVLARENNDPSYKKLIKIQKAKLTIINKLREKYGLQAEAKVKRAKKTVKNRKVSKNSRSVPKKSSYSSSGVDI